MTLAPHRSSEDELFSVLMDMERALRLPADGSYHSQAHVMHVAAIAYGMGQLAGLSRQNCAHLLVAGLFHDAGHARTMYMEDKHNIGVAVSLFDEWEFEGIDSQTVVEMIRSTTEEPEKTQRVMRSPHLYQILVDADILVAAMAPMHEEEISQGLLSEGYPAIKTEQFLQSRGVFTDQAQILLRMAGYHVGKH